MARQVDQPRWATRSRSPRRTLIRRGIQFRGIQFRGIQFRGIQIEYDLANQNYYT